MLSMKIKIQKLHN